MYQYSKTMATVSKTKEAQDKSVGKIEENLYRLDFLTFGRITVALPLLSLIFCFLTCIIFKFEQVNKTVCNVSMVYCSNIYISKYQYNPIHKRGFYNVDVQYVLTCWCLLWQISCLLLHCVLCCTSNQGHSTIKKLSIVYSTITMYLKTVKV